MVCARVGESVVGRVGGFDRSRGTIGVGPPSPAEDQAKTWQVLERSLKDQGLACLKVLDLKILYQKYWSLKVLLFWSGGLGMWLLSEDQGADLEVKRKHENWSARREAL